MKGNRVDLLVDTESIDQLDCRLGDMTLDGLDDLVRHGESLLEALLDGLMYQHGMAGISERYHTSVISSRIRVISFVLLDKQLQCGGLTAKTPSTPSDA